MFEFRDIEIIQSVVRHGGFRGASEALGLAQSAVSRRIRHLEDRLRITIFERAGRGVRLSASGRRLFEEGEILIAQRDRIIGELTSNIYAGTVRLGVAETMAQKFLPRMLTRIRQAHPHLRFEVVIDTSDRMADALVQDELDVVIHLRDQAPPGATVTPLMSVDLGWYIHPDHFRLDHVLSRAELAKFPIVSFSKPTMPHRRVVEMLSVQLEQPVLVHGSASLATMMDLVAQGFGVGTLPRMLVASSPHLGLVELEADVEASLPDLEFAICYMSDKNSKFGREVTRFAIGTALEMML
ncbi:LysR family transcriptional regulator [Pseudooceanicola albus]|nr:LysR family transcriptional regulator [Pseudooceanicola albus]